MTCQTYVVNGQLETCWGVDWWDHLFHKKMSTLAFVRASYSPRLYIGISCWLLTLLLAPRLRPWYKRWMMDQTAASEWVQRYIGTRSEVMRHCRRTQTKLDCAESSRSSLYAAAVHTSSHPIHAGAVLMGAFTFKLTIYSLLSHD